LAIKGKICPGLAKSCGLVSALAKTKVLALSADIPVVTPPPLKSETVKAFP
jgi:hypothetical protein